MQSHRAIHRRQCRLESFFIRDVITGLKRVRRIEANSHRQITSLIENTFQFLKPRAYRRAHSRSIFNQYAQLAQLDSFHGMADAIRDF